MKYFKTVQGMAALAVLFLFQNCGGSASNTNTPPVPPNQSNQRATYNQDASKTPQELRAELLGQERNTPMEYLSVKNLKFQEQTRRVANGGLFNGAKYYPDGAIVEGDITNRATMAKYKDVMLTVSFFTKTNTFLDKASFVVYEYFEPRATKHFSYRINQLPEAFGDYKIQITAASPAN